MNDLIKINYESEKPTVSGRELHTALETKTAYKDWFPRMCEYGFVEGEDFCSKMSESTGGRPCTDHQLTIPMAKELCMLQRNENGKMFRQYFIKVEEAWNSPEMVMKRALEFADRKIKQLTSQITADAPKVLFAEAVSVSKASILIGELTKLLKQNGVETGQNRLFEWLRANGYLIKRNGTEYNMPTQKSMEMELFEIKKTVITHSDGHTSVNKTPKVTGKGQQYFINVFLGKEHISKGK